MFVGHGANLQAIRENGLQIDDVASSFVVRPAQATYDPETVGAVDVVLVAVKGWQIAGAAVTARPLLAPDTFVVPLTDEAPGELANALGKGRIVPGLAVMLGSVIIPGHIRNTLQKTYITMGELDGLSSERVVRFQKVCEKAGVAANISTDIRSALWEKLILVGPYGGVGAVTRAPQGVFRTIPETRQLLEGAIGEVLTVARAHGAKLSDDVVKQTLTWLDRGPAAGIGAMQRDIMAGRPSELDTQIGAVVRLARTAGVEALRHAFLYASLLPQERKARGEIEFPVVDKQASKAA